MTAPPWIKSFLMSGSLNANQSDSCVGSRPIRLHFHIISPRDNLIGFHNWKYRLLQDFHSIIYCLWTLDLIYRLKILSKLLFLYRLIYVMIFIWEKDLPFPVSWPNIHTSNWRGYRSGEFFFNCSATEPNFSKAPMLLKYHKVITKMTF